MALGQRFFIENVQSGTLDPVFGEHLDHRTLINHRPAADVDHHRSLLHRSDVNPCHRHLRERTEDVKRGVWQAGGYPMEIPVMTLGETFQKPTTTMYRNLLAMETEEVLRSYPLDGCVLLGSCDKTTPALLMGAISMNLPAIYVPAGPMLRNWRGEILAIIYLSNHTLFARLRY